MNEIEFKGIKIANWIDYINYKFADKDLFEIKVSDDNIDIRVFSKKNKTIIYFAGLFNNSELGDCQYYNDDCKGWSGETIGVDCEKYGSFTLENIEALEITLETPIYKGWISVDYYLFGNFLKAQTFYDNDTTKAPFTYFASGFGCISLVLFPIFIPINFLMNRGLIGEKKVITIEPIIKRND